jgi:hypothetical protein
MKMAMIIAELASIDIVIGIILLFLIAISVLDLYVRSWSYTWYSSSFCYTRLRFSFDCDCTFGAIGLICRRVTGGNK